MPNPGDLICIDRGAYEHWAVYTDKGNVIHVTECEGAGGGFSSVKSVSATKAVVKEEKLDDVAGGDKWEVRNLWDQKCPPRPPKDIVKDARSKVDTEVSYNLLRKNCEHFVTELRYGRPMSLQVQNAAEVAVGGVATVALVGALAYAASGRATEKKKKESKE